MPIPRSARRRLSVRALLAPFALTAVVALSGGSAVAAPRSPAPAVPAAQTSGWCADAEEMAFLELVNAYRAQNGLGPLTLSPTLGAAADAHSLEMAANNYFDHTMLGGVSIAENLAAHGYPGRTYTENIAAGSEGAVATLAQWQGSAVHNASLLGGAYEALGIGRAYGPNSGYGWYWTAIFGGEADGAAPACDGSPAPVDVPAPAALPISPAAVPSPSPAPAPDLAAGARATADLDLRAGPGTDYAALGTVPSGSQMEVAGSAEAGYLPVTVDGRFGWVVAEFVALGADVGPASDGPD